MITDDTLREGLQTPGISYTKDEKLKIAELLKKAGIKRALVSYPSAHESEREVTESIVKGNYFEETYGLGRTMRKDIDIIDETGANISMHLPFRFDGLDDIIDAVKYASGKGKLVEVAVVDIVKYNENELLKIASAISGAGTDVIQLPDTTGSASPSNVMKLISKVRKNLDSEIEVHCHNDYGAAVSNSLAGANAGANYVDTTVYGLGERNGIADMASTVAILQKEGYEIPIKLESLKEVYNYLQELIFRKIGPNLFADNYPVFGKNTSVHTAGTHAAFGDVFRGSSFSVNVYTGKDMIRNILKANDVELEDEKLKKLVNSIKDQAVESGRSVPLKDILKMAGELQ